MTRLTRLLPATNLGRTRLAATVLGCLMVAPLAGQTGNHLNSAAWNRAGLIAVFTVIGTLVLAFLRSRVSWWQMLTLPGLILVAASSLVDPLAGIGLAIASIMALSLYGRFGLWLVGALGAVVAVPAAIAMTPDSLGRMLVWHSGPVLGILPGPLLMSVMMRGIYMALLDHERASARDAVLARTGTDILAATSLEQVYRLGYLAATDILALYPGVGWLVMRRLPEGLTVLNVTGLPDELRGRVVPDGVIAEPALFGELVAGYRHWRTDSFPDELHVAIGGAKRVPDALFDAVRTLSNQVVLGERTIESHAALDHQANHDHLTQLATRAKFFRQLSTAVDEEPPGSVALLNIDLDDFKQINDTYGHAAGDQLLVEVASRMQRLSVPGAVPARFGGDEFAMLLTGLIRPEDAEVIAGRLCDELVRPVRVADTTVTVGASIGVAVAASGYSAADLTRCADIAMYSAKAQGKNRVERFDPVRHGDIARQRTLEKHLGESLAHTEITLRYAPWVDPRTGTCLGIEALANWEHPTFGRLEHVELLRMAAQTGDLPGLVRHLLRAACAEFAELPGGPYQLGFAVPARQLLDPTFGPDLVAIAAAAGIDPSRLTCEIIDAERVDVRPGLTALADLGVTVALDARTTADATVSSLSETAVHQLTVDAADEAAVGLVLLMSGFLGINTVVQGVSTPEQLARLGDLAVTAVRGPAVGPPMDTVELRRWLAIGTTAPHLNVPIP